MNLLIVNGWSAQAALWADFIALLAENWTVSVLDLDQVGDVAFWCRRIDAQLTQPSLILGWSLGGALATEYVAHTANQNCRGLVTVATNPCFVVRDNWHCAMSEAVFAEFSTLVESGELNALARRFRFLLTQDRTELSRLKSLYNEDTLPSLAALQSGLVLLKTLDVRVHLPQLKIPHLSVFGTDDALVPITVSERTTPNSTIRIEGMGHLPCLSFAPALKDQLQAFVAELV